MSALSTGTRLGPYEILDAIGAGGMGEVYRGRDTRLDRVVAIKVLAAGLASDITSRERFEREAKVISSLNHPNICVLHDVGRERPSGGDGPPLDFLVMEYLEGETLSARIARGPSRASRHVALSRAESPPPLSAPPPSPPAAMPPLTVEEALAIAVPIAAALDCAHRQGIVHRDLKPGNVMLTANTVKLLDFGLARLSSGAGPDRKDALGHGMVSLADLSMPTVSSPLTVKGTILGTLQYMAPEQLEGKAVDARADIFAFGGMLYEMLTGRRPFEGKSQASLIGAILDHEPPPVTTHQPISPPLLDEIVARCLAKDPGDRWQSAHDLASQLKWVSRQVAGGAAVTASQPPAALRPRAARVGLAGLVLVGTALVTGGAVAWLMRAPPPVVPAVTRFALELPDDHAFTRAGRHLIALSPDGSRLVYVANNQLNLRAMHELNAKPIAGTERTDPAEPVFSPDGQWVAFWSDNTLQKVAVTGGKPIALSAAQNPWGSSWVGDRILLGQAAPRGIVEVPDAGGPATLLIGVDEKKGEWAHGPQLIADGRAVLFTLRTGAGVWDGASIVVQELSSGRRVVLVNGGTDGRVLPTGHLVYVREATMFAVPFDAAHLAVSGEPIEVAHGIQQSAPATSGAAQFAWSRSGSLALVPGEAFTTDRTLTWVDRQGGQERSAAPSRAYAIGGSAVRISPDGTRVAVTIRADERPTGLGRVAATSSEAVLPSDIWIWEIARNMLSRLSMTNQASSAVWTVDSRRVCYRDGADVVCQAADGSGPREKLLQPAGLRNVKGFSRDGLNLILGVRSQATRDDIVMVTLDRPSEIRPLVNTAFADLGPALSPDGRWLAYDSDESGRSEVYVRPFPAVDQARWQVSTDGGIEPRWSHDSRELVFSSDDEAGPRGYWSVAITRAAGFVAGKPIEVATVPNSAGSSYDLARDGRILVHLPTALAARPPRPQLHVVQNWFEELKARVTAATP